MRTFVLNRLEDTTGISGTGVVAEGVQFQDGTVAIHWHGKHRSTVIWPDIYSAEAVHCHGGNTEIVWDDDKDDGGGHFVSALRNMPYPMAYCGKAGKRGVYKTHTYRLDGDHLIGYTYRGEDVTCEKCIEAIYEKSKGQG